MLAGIVELAERGALAGGLFRNADDYGRFAEFGDTPETLQHVICDPQTSGGLLIAIQPQATDGLLKRLAEEGVDASRIGEAREGQAGRLVFGASA